MVIVDLVGIDLVKGSLLSIVSILHVTRSTMFNHINNS